MTVTVQGFEAFLLVLVRITAFIYVAPFFSLKNVPQKVKVGFSFFLALIIFQTLPNVTIEYQTVIGYAAKVFSEAMLGLIIGFFTNVSYYILTFAGSLMDMEIGFSMANEFDPVFGLQSTLTSNLYSYLVVLMMMVTNLHHYLILALVDTYKVIPLAGAVFNPNMYLLMLKFMQDYFILGFRIVLPVFGCMLLLNSILAILAKIAPQMNMFVIGMQLKVAVGLFVLFLVIRLVPTVSNLIFTEMINMMKSAIEVLS